MAHLLSTAHVTLISVALARVYRRLMHGLKLIFIVLATLATLAGAAWLYFAVRANLARRGL